MSIPHINEEKSKNKSIKANFIATIILAALILMTASILASSSSPPPAYYQQSAFGQTYAGANGPIVFESRRDGNWNIFGVFPGVTQERVTPLVTNPADDVHGSLSPDGTKLLFASNRDGGDREIFVQVLTGFRPPLRMLTNNDAVDEAPNWSPDGTEIVFVSDRDGDPEIWKMPDRVGAPQTQLTNNRIGDTLPVWSPDGTRIAFVSNRDVGGGTEIYTMNNDGSNQRRFTQHPDLDSWPSWSPDGTRIAFSSNRDGDHDIYVKRVNAPLLSPPQGPLTTSGSFDGQPSWSPDGTRIAFMTNRFENNRDIVSMPAGGPDIRGQLRQHAMHDARDEFPHWSKTQPTISPLPPPPVQDSDNDGIFDNIDEQPRIFSERFSDVPLGGSTSGFVTRSQVAIEIKDEPNPDGVSVRGYTQAGYPGGPSPSLVTIIPCPAGTTMTSGSMVTYISPNTDEILTCSSLDQTVLRGTVPTTLVGEDGSTAKIDVPAPNAISFDPATNTLTAGPGNVDSLNVIFVIGDVEQEPRPLLPGGSLVVDTIPPETTIDSATDSLGKNPIQDGSRTPSQGILFEFSSPDSDVSIIECSLDSNTWEACTNNVAGYDNLTEGQHIFEVRARDGANNIDPTPDVFSWTIDTIPPETTIDSATDGQGNPIQNQSSTLSTDISFQFSSPDSDDVSVFECSLDSGDWELCPGRFAGVIAETEVHSYSDLPSGEHIFEVRARDGAGNVDPTPLTWIWTITQAEEPMPSTNAFDMTPPKL